MTQTWCATRGAVKTAQKIICLYLGPFPSVQAVFKSSAVNALTCCDIDDLKAK